MVVPDEWELYKNEKGEYSVKSTWGWCYEINELLTDIHGHPAFRALDENGRPHTVYLYTLEELEEKKRKEEEKKRKEEEKKRKEEEKKRKEEEKKRKEEEKKKRREAKEKKNKL